MMSLRTNEKRICKNKWFMHPKKVRKEGGRERRKEGERRGTKDGRNKGRRNEERRRKRKAARGKEGLFFLIENLAEVKDKKLLSFVLRFGA